MTESGTSSCPRCGAAAAGRFCASCGASLRPATCASCGAESAPGGRFCTSCGASLAAPGPGGGVGAGAGAVHAGSRPGAPGGSGSVAAGRVAPHPGWWVAGLFLVGLIVMVAYPAVLQRGGEGAPAGVPGGAGAGAGGALGPAPAVDLQSMSPRDAADRLYERIMRAVSARDSTEIRNFLPMAVAAYERARPLDADGHFHLSLLLRTGLDFEAALAEARAGLELEPNHILNLSAAAEASAELGDTALARAYFARLLEVYQGEVARELEEYLAHETLLPQMRREAEAFLEAAQP